MDSSAFLDYALFQLTPTRTRCDLILFYGGKNEKLASGLFEPFLSHLNFAKDQISKGGYSIKLCPPNINASWFTKGTFERFVRFVSTPAVLERFVGLENEILQIESSVQANELANNAIAGQLENGSESAASANTRKSSDSSKLKNELEGSNAAVLEESSKIQLQRLLETRKRLLLKEQAMAYARGHVAGFELDNMDDLISFSDTFGASRLREACINFKELCKKKRGDGLWMEELAAMEACPPAELSFLGTSGIVLTNETLNQNVPLNLVQNEMSDGSRSVSTASNTSTDFKKGDDAKVQVPMPWPNQIPQYMYNYQTPMQQLPPGFPFHTMQPIPPQYSGHMYWPPGMKDSGPLTKEKSGNRKGTEYSGESGETESSGSEAGSDSDSYVQQDKKLSSTDAPSRKKHRKKSSKMVVIRNINYITPERRNREKDDGVSDESSSGENEFIDEDSLKQKVDDAVGLLGKLHKSKTRNRSKKGSHKGNGVVTNGSDDPSQGFDNAGKTNENWGAFQNLLMRDEETASNVPGNLQRGDFQDDHFKVRISGDETSSIVDPTMDVEVQKLPKQLLSETDSFVMNQRGIVLEDRIRPEDIENAENFRPLMKRISSTEEDLVISRRPEESGNGIGGILSSFPTESSIIKSGKGEDWFVINHSGKPENRAVFNDDFMMTLDKHSSNAEKNGKGLPVDDSFMVHARPAVDDPYDSQWRTEMSFVADVTLSSQVENRNAQDNHQVPDAYEPNDLCMVLERGSGFESTRESWTTDPGMDISFMETDRRSSVADTSEPSNSDSTETKKTGADGKKVPAKEVRSKVMNGSPWKSRTEMMSKAKKPSLVSRPAVQKSKLEKEEEMRKKMEELSIQRQKRISERTAAATKKVPAEMKSVRGSIKLDKNKTQATTRETIKTTSLKVRAA